MVIATFSIANFKFNFSFAVYVFHFILATFLPICRSSSWKWNKWLYIHPCWRWSESTKNCCMTSFLQNCNLIKKFPLFFPLYCFQSIHIYYSLLPPMPLSLYFAAYFMVLQCICVKKSWSERNGWKDALVWYSICMWLI